MIFTVMVFNMLLINLIISMLANTYGLFDARSSGLYLAQILSSRDEINFDHSFGAFLSSMPIINLIQAPFLPVALGLKKGDPRLQ